MSIEPLNFSNNKYELTGNEQNTVTQKKDTINNVMNPDNRIVEDESYKTNSEADKEKTKAGITGVEIAARIIRECKPYCQGVHIMALGWESKIPDLLKLAEI